MSRRRTRAVTLAVGAAVAVACFLLARATPERPTEVGRERRLFALTPTAGSASPPYRLVPGPQGRTLVALFGDPGAGAVKNWRTQLMAWGRELLRMPGRARRLSLVEPFGTWQVSGGSVRRVWRYPVSDVAQDRYLMGAAGVDATGSDIPATLDLRTGRTYVGAAAGTELSRAGIPGFSYSWEPWSDEEPGDPVGAFSPGIEGSAEAVPAEHQETRVIGGRQVRLITRYPYEAGETPVFAAMPAPAPRLLPLVERTVQHQLTPDGRTLYFVRDGALWRLDLRKPLPQLLDEAAPPPLPEPDLSESVAPEPAVGP